MPDWSRLSTVAGVVSVSLIGLAAVILTVPGQESDWRIGVLFGLLGIAMTSLTGSLRPNNTRKTPPKENE